ncbi:MAG: type II secretion system protein [Labilithrix sp.]|nr:type II secretion system protein [Labilithrix sp.]MCW5815887.1 type II secretion system protein [Labilithrix sp.]
MSIPRRKTSLRRARARGFTLTELMVALVMGLIVALASVALARSATLTFHEEVRTSSTEMALRMGADRLRQDLSRASFMSTPNIVLDPKVARLANVPDGDANVARYAGILRLRGLRIDVGSTQFGVPAPLTDVGIVPDAVEIVGNMTSDDAYSGTITMNAGAGGGCANAQTITLDPNADAAVYQLAGMSASVPYDDTRFRNNARTAFQPVAGRRFLAQVTDAIGCHHYVPVCNVDVAGGRLAVTVSGDTNLRGVLYANSGSGVGGDSYENPAGGVARGCGSSEGGRVTIAPLSRVVWRLALATESMNASFHTEPGLGQVAKVDLVRQVIDFDGVAVGPPEVIAEYATDLKFGIVLDVPGATGAARHVVYDMDTDNGNGSIFNATNGPNSILPGQPGPQRVRSVRFRLAIRAAVADREVDLPTGVATSRARVCVDTATPCRKFARVRTVVSEVALTNQAGAFY